MSAQGAKPPVKITYATMSGDQLEELHGTLDAAIPAVRAAFGQTHPMWINGHAVKTVDHFPDTNIAAKGEQVLRAGLQPGRPGPHLSDKVIRVDRNRLVRGSVVLTEVGVSQRDVPVCLSELLDSEPSPSWVNAELAQVERVATAINQAWQPQLEESWSGDELYANGQPNLLLVGNDSLYIYALSRQPSCDGDTWGCLLLEGPDCRQFASDGGTGLAAGAKAAEIEVHQLDWDHLLRPLWGQAARLEKQAYAALQQVEKNYLQADDCSPCGH